MKFVWGRKVKRDIFERAVGPLMKGSKSNGDRGIGEGREDRTCSGDRRA